MLFRSSANAPQESTSTPKSTTENEAVVFAVQLAASKNNVALIPANFKGLSGVKKQDFGPLYKYFWGHTSSYSEVKKSLTTAQQSGYPSAFVVALKNGKLVSVQEALGANK